ncbi:MAG: PrkA family serine protein kinase [Burkholderiaceae bacterium]|jgi:serine protein kinase|nr:PrkA family serine protein kinase [Burkholderiaceae bacterium]
MNAPTELFTAFRESFVSALDEEMGVEDFLRYCKSDRMAYASAHECVLEAIGKPKLVNTADDARLSRIFQNRVIQTWDAFADFHGMEETLMSLYAYFLHAAQGLEERKQVLYLLGPVGGGKSSLAEKIKSLCEQFPIYTLKDSVTGRLSPMLESPLGLFPRDRFGAEMEDRYGIPRRALTGIATPWALKRLKEYKGDLSKFQVVRLMPSVLNQIGIVKTEPGDENTQDISSLVGKVDLRMLEQFAQDDPDAYSYSGALCLGSARCVEFVEMFKAPLKVLNPILTATQEGNFKGTEALPALPFNGFIMAHSNEAEWLKFRNNKDNEAFIDRVYLVKVPYCLRVDEEVRIYEKMLTASTLSESPCAPQTLRTLAEFSVLSRLAVPENSSVFSKLRSYNGETLKDVDPRSKSVKEYRDDAGMQEGFSGLSTRWAFKTISAAFNRDPSEIAADPVNLLVVLEDRLAKEDIQEEYKRRLRGHIKEWIVPRFAEFLEKELQMSYLDAYGEYGQNLFDRYVTYADKWLLDEDWRDPDTGMQYSRDALNTELEKIEKPAGISNPKDFRNEVVNFVLRARAHGKNPHWTSYEKLRVVIEKRMFSKTEDILPIISFEAKGSQEMEERHKSFVNRMAARGYTEKQVRRLVDWYMHFKKSTQS